MRPARTVRSATRLTKSPAAPGPPVRYRYTRLMSASTRGYALRGPPGRVRAALFLACLLLGASGCQTIRRHEGPIAYVADSAINAHVEIALVHDPRVAAPEIDVHTYRATVTLDGTVDSAEMKRAAERIARSTPGVRTVVNRLKVADATAREPPAPP